LASCVDRAYGDRHHVAGLVDLVRDRIGAMLA
jgi:hypothetical protein